MPGARGAEFAALVDDLVRVRGELFEPVEEVARIGAGARQRQVLAGAAVQRGHALAADRLEARAPRGCGRRAIEPHLRGELVPFGLVQLFELQRRHGRLPSAHWATPSTRRVTSDRMRRLVALHGCGDRGQLVEPFHRERRGARRERDHAA